MRVHLLLFSLICCRVYGAILSMDMCSDLWVLDHYPEEQIVALTYLSQEPKSLARHHGTTEEILRANPSLVISEFPLSSKQSYYLKKHNIPLKTLPPLDRLEDLYKRFPNARGLNIPPIGPGKKALILTQGLHTPGKETFWGDVLEALGFINLSANAGIIQWGYLSSEKILALKPDLIIVFGEDTSLPPSLRSFPIKQISAKDYLCPSPQGIQKIVESLQCVK